MYAYVYMVKVFLKSATTCSNPIMTSAEDVRFYNKVIGVKYPLCGNVWGAADDIKLLSEAPSDGIKQNRLYNGWTNGHYINCVFVFVNRNINPCIQDAPILCATTIV